MYMILARITPGKKLLCQMKHLKTFKILSLLVFITISANADEYKVDGIYPSHWWIRMKNPRLQLMIRGSNIQENSFSLTYPGVKLEKVNKPENKNYVFLNLFISSTAKPGTFKIHIKNQDGEGDIKYELKPRRSGNGTAFASGVGHEDFVY